MSTPPRRRSKLRQQTSRYWWAFRRGSRWLAGGESPMIIFAAVLLGVSGLYVSYQSKNISEKSNDISAQTNQLVERQNELVRQGLSPNFQLAIDNHLSSAELVPAHSDYAGWGMG